MQSTMAATLIMQRNVPDKRRLSEPKITERTDKQIDSTWESENKNEEGQIINSGQ